MGGFLSSSAPMLICRANDPKPLDIAKLREAAFTDAPDPEGRRYGFVGLGQLLDTENFYLALSDARFAAFSFRMDTRKPSAAAIRLQLEEKIKEEKEAGQKVGSARRKELREAITEALTSQAPYVPTLTDCIWDGEKGRLFVACASARAAQPLFDLFDGAFQMDLEIIEPQVDMGEVFAKIQRENGIMASGFKIQPMGSASLAGVDTDEKSAVAVMNKPEAVAQALADGLMIRKMGLVASRNEEDENQLFFTLDSGLVVSGLRLPKPDKDDEEDATFLINAEICATTADIVEALGETTGQ